MSHTETAVPPPVLSGRSWPRVLQGLVGGGATVNHCQSMNWLSVFIMTMVHSHAAAECVVQGSAFPNHEY